jgi:hypothetical protein
MVEKGGYAYLDPFLPLYYLLTPILLSLLAPSPSLRPLSKSGSGPKASRLLLIEWEARGKQTQQLVAFVGVSNSNQFLSAPLTAR